MIYQCPVCGYIYDEREGDPWNNIPPTPLKDLKDWKCPICGNSKEYFKVIKF